MLKSKLESLEKSTYKPMVEKFLINSAPDDLFTGVKDSYDEYKIEHRSGDVNFDSIRKNLKLPDNKHRKFTTDKFESIRNNEEFKRIYDSLGRRHNYDNHDHLDNGQYHSKNIDDQNSEDTDSDDHDNDDKDSDDRDSDDQNSEDTDSDDQDNNDKDSDDRDSDDRDSDDQNGDDHNGDSYDEDDNYYQRRSYYQSRRNAHGRREKKSQCDYDGNRRRPRFTKGARHDVEDNFRNAIRQVRTTDREAKQPWSGLSARRFQRQDDYQNDKITRVQHRRKSFGDTRSDCSKKEESSNSIKNFFKNINKKIENELLRSIFSHAEGNNKYS
ncbi:hypothetical protein C922_05572 [Plasmodium inui San Antonio 1]|uniref:Uncharacterized protein n=1 Tax=Plasmodium inui San Antonio 1 TaxID=1237626 RepID=W7AFJ4_9APIC|nr:hypothetical protein C922_05572 [Plasmodium inui San Antonio 1]EUD64046.1 hypothetical protein C922_05572 [Plasmodium inui San Antonio 1]